MPGVPAHIGAFHTIGVDQLQLLLNALQSRGYRTIAPRIMDGAIVYSEIAKIEQLPVGVIDRQDGGTYRLEKVPTSGYFDYVVGPQSLKGYLFPPRETLLKSVRKNGDWQFTVPPVEAPPLAVLGVRSCDLHALAIQDKVFLGGPYVDPGYQARRQNLFLVAVNCRRAAATCFCHSMNTGPAARQGFDLALTELSPDFLIEVGSPSGGELVAELQLAPATPRQVEEGRVISDLLVAELQGRAAKASNEVSAPAESPGASGTTPPIRERFLDTTNIHGLLLGNLEHPRWQETAERCLACSNCTMVCPTCFCAAVEDVSDLSGDNVRRERAWDSCFTAEHSTMNTGTVRKTTASRYRQWLTHKLATWHEQFGTSGCVGCGRCITWCPVGIDLTEEVVAIRDHDGAKARNEV
ncbi:MAG: 4Fe-4S dicluster domain-containing protein [Pirellulales bacterium]|nr:4Fe-4S dicluster domain-containing protein [Pirellulales bacterium]